MGVDRGVRELFPDDAGDDALTPVLAAVRALEPKRTRRELAAASGVDPTTFTALEHLIQLTEESWWPGGAGPGVAEVLRWEPGEPADVETLWWGEVVPRALARRTTEPRRTSTGDSTDEPTEDDRWAAAARAAGDDAGVAHVRLIQADIVRRTGDPETAGRLAAGIPIDPGTSPGAAAARALLLGDLAVTPWATPETLGSTLDRPLDDTRFRPEGFAEAERRYGEARAVLVEAGRDRGVAALDLRLAFTARLRGDPAEAARLLDESVERAWRSGDGGTAVLALVHRELLRLAEDEASSRTDPSPRIATWVAEDGSPGWVLGCARVVLAAADRAGYRGAVEQALATHTFAERLVAVSGLVDLEVFTGRVPLLLRVRSHGLVVSTWEEQYAAFPAEGELSPEQWEWAATGLVATAVPMSLDGDPEGLASVVARARQLLARAPGGPREVCPSDVLERIAAESSPAHDPIDSTVWSLSDLVEGLPALAGLSRAEVNLAQGRAQAAAIALAQMRTTSRPDLAIRGLALEGRLDEAKERAEAYLGPEPPIGAELTAELWLLVGEARRARALLQPDSESDPWVSIWEQNWAGDELRARIALADDRAADARTIAERGVQRLEDWFSALTSDTFRVSALDDDSAAQLFDVLVATCLRLEDDDSAFRFADRLRSIALGALRGDPGSPAFRRWRQARAEWNGAVDQRRNAWRTRKPTELAGTAAGLAEAEERLERAAEDLRTAGIRPEPRKTMAPVEAADIAKVLDDDTVLIHQTLVQGRLVVALVTRSGVKVRPLDVPALALTKLCTDLHRAWSLPAQIRSMADDLAALLLEPVTDLLADHRRVLVVPCAPALAIPFAALPFAGSCLLDGWTVSQLPAASLIPGLAGQPAPRMDGDCLVVGNPASSTHGALPGAEAEAILVGRALGGRTVVGAEATEERLRAELTTRTPVAHLACHAELDPVARDLSPLILAGSDRLTVAELLGIGLDVDLAVLSACVSGRGTVTRSGDLVGLQRGLLAAGVRHTVTSLWNVEDRAACLTMTDFAEHLANGVGVAESLARAQRGVRALTRAEANDRYLELGARAGVDVTAGRGVGQRGEATRGSGKGLGPTQWAPFVHLGV